MNQRFARPLLICATGGDSVHRTEVLLALRSGLWCGVWRTRHENPLVSGAPGDTQALKEDSGPDPQRHSA